MSFEIIVTEEIDEKGGKVLMYGLAADWGERFESICPRQEPIHQMQQILNNPDLSAQHQRDVLEDMVQQLYMI